MNYKKSSTINLLVIGTIAVTSLTACDQEPDTQQVMQGEYKSREDCIRDWGNDASRCTPNSSGGGYIGPRYFWDHASNTPMIYNSSGSAVPATNSFASRGVASSARAVSTASVSRGGFGATAHGISSSAGG